MIKHVFGPVPSRRLGISLGVDVVPFKTCTLDCVYCECGKTTNLTTQRDCFVEPETILREIRDAVQAHSNIEYITFSGSGEPTLHRDIGTIIKGIKKITDIPVAVLTNATLLYRQDVQLDLMEADLILPSLDAVTPATFKKINGPHDQLEIDTVIEGLLAFCKVFQGSIWLEIFIAKGINDNKEELHQLHRLVNQMQPDKVQLNSLDRPPAYENIEAVAVETLEKIVTEWADLPVEMIKKIKKREEITSFSKNLENNILNTINRRPLTIEDLEVLTGKKRVELYKYIDVLEKEKKLKPQIVGDKIFLAPIKEG